MQTFFSPDFKKILLSFWSVHYQEGPVSNFWKLNRHICMQKKKKVKIWPVPAQACQLISYAKVYGIKCIQIVGNFQMSSGKIGFLRKCEHCEDWRRAPFTLLHGNRNVGQVIRLDVEPSTTRKLFGVKDCTETLTQVQSVSEQQAWLTNRVSYHRNLFHSPALALGNRLGLIRACAWHISIPWSIMFHFRSNQSI